MASADWNQIGSVQFFFDFSTAIERELSVNDINQIHDPFVFFAGRHRVVIPAGAGYSQQLALSFQRNIFVAFFNQRYFPLMG
jgi:hypothetical protein